MSGCRDEPGARSFTYALDALTVTLARHPDELTVALEVEALEAIHDTFALRARDAQGGIPAAPQSKETDEWCEFELQCDRAQTPKHHPN